MKKFDVIWHEGFPPRKAHGHYLVMSYPGWLKLMQFYKGKSSELTEPWKSDITHYAQVTNFKEWD